MRDKKIGRAHAVTQAVLLRRHPGVLCNPSDGRPQPDRSIAERSQIHSNNEGDVLRALLPQWAGGQEFKESKLEIQAAMLESNGGRLEFQGAKLEF